MRSRADLSSAEPKIEAFLTDLAVHGHVVAAAQNQAMNALVCLYKRILNQVMEGRINAVRAAKPASSTARKLSMLQPHHITSTPKVLHTVPANPQARATSRQNRTLKLHHHS